jgi:tight adherence protein B
MTAPIVACALLTAAAVSLAVPASAGPRLHRLGRERGAASQRGLVLAAVASAAVASTLVVALTATVAVVVAVHVARRVSSRRDRRRASEGVPEACTRIARLLRAGEHPHRALRQAAHGLPDGLGAALREAAATADLGGSAADSLRRPGPLADALAPLASCWAISAELGAPLAPALSAVAAALTAERQHRREVDAELAGPRLTAWLLAGLPAFGVAVAAVLGGRPGSMLLGTPLGASCLGAAAVLDGTGVWWLRRVGRT